MKSFLTLLFIYLSIYMLSQESLPKQTLRETVMDETLKIPIPNAVVFINTSPERNTLSNELGEFHFPNIPVGGYTVKIYRDEYESLIIPEIQVTSSKET